MRTPHWALKLELRRHLLSGRRDLVQQICQDLQIGRVSDPSKLADRLRHHLFQTLDGCGNAARY